MLRIAISTLLLAMLAPPLHAAEPDTHIVFLAGPKDHGFAGRHEYEADLRVLQKAFTEAPNIPKVRTSFYLGKAPPAAAIADASVIVILSSSDRAANEVHPLFPPDPTTDHHRYDDATKAFLQGYDDLVRKKGMGVVILHYAVWAENWAAREIHLNWTGGLWVQMASRNPVDQWSMQPVNTTHPVLNGVQPWKYRDEIFSRFLLPEDYRRTNLIVATPEEDRNGIGPQVAAWAYQRDDGGRAFVFGGVDFHDAMLGDNYRRFLLNGIYWAARGKVPAEGVKSTTPTDIKPYVAAPVASTTQIDWPVFGGSAAQSRYVDHTAITPANVSELAVAWTYPVTDSNIYQFSPVIADGVMYVLAKDNSLVALDARNGKELWSRPGFQGISRRGVNYWKSTDGTDRRLLVTASDQLLALDARNGNPINTFGVQGKVDLREHLGRDVESVRRVQAASPGAIFEDLILLGSSPGEGYLAPPGHLRAYNVVTGKLQWIFHTIPQPGEFGYDTWPKDAWRYAGGANNWGEITVDAARGIAYFPLGSPTYDYYGADRIGANLFGNCLLALDARTGKRLWHFQTVHHDLWDYDLTAAPQLLEVTRHGKRVAAVAQAAKSGFLFVFDRVSGKPLFDIEERPVPASTMPGEQAWPTQPFPVGLPITARQKLTADDVTHTFLTPAERTAWLARIAGARSGLFLPLSEVETIALPGGVGGTNWGNTAADPRRGILYVMNQDFPSFYRLEKEERVRASAANASTQPFTRAQISAGEVAYKLYCQVCHGGDRAGGNNGPGLLTLQGKITVQELHRIVTRGQNRMPAQPHLDDDTITALLAFLSGGKAPTFLVGADYPADVDAPTVQYRTDYGLSAPHIMAPPWSTIMAIDLNSGKLLWKVPLGQDQEATALGLTGTGVPRGTQRNGMIVTATGLVFSTAKDGKVYAFDAKDGRVLWTGQLPMGTEGLPAMYVLDGRQYLVVNATTPLTWGTKSRESGIGSTLPTGKGGYVVFALPAQSRSGKSP